MRYIFILLLLISCSAEELELRQLCTYDWVYQDQVDDYCSGYRFSHNLSILYLNNIAIGFKDECRAYKQLLGRWKPVVINIPAVLHLAGYTATGMAVGEVYQPFISINYGNGSYGSAAITNTMCIQERFLAVSYIVEGCN